MTSKNGFMQTSLSLILTEFILLGSRTVSTKRSEFFPVNILCNLLSPALVRSLTVWFDSDFSLSCNARNTCKACFLNISDLKQLRGYFMCEAALLAANALVGSCLDYCIPCFEVSLLLSSSGFKTVLQELWQIPQSTRISLL